MYTIPQIQNNVSLVQIETHVWKNLRISNTSDIGLDNHKYNNMFYKKMVPTLKTFTESMK